MCTWAHAHMYMCMHTHVCSHVPVHVNMPQHACGGQRANFLESVLSFHNRTRDQIPVVRPVCQASAFTHPKMSLRPNLMLLTFAWMRCTKFLSGPTKGCLFDLRLQRRTNSGWLDGRLVTPDGFCCLVSLYYCFMRLKKKGNLRLSQINLFSKHWAISQIIFV